MHLEARINSHGHLVLGHVQRERFQRMPKTFANEHFSVSPSLSRCTTSIPISSSTQISRALTLSQWASGLTNSVVQRMFQWQITKRSVRYGSISVACSLSFSLITPIRQRLFWLFPNPAKFFPSSQFGAARPTKVYRRRMRFDGTRPMHWASPMDMEIHGIGVHAKPRRM